MRLLRVFVSLAVLSHVFATHDCRLFALGIPLLDLVEALEERNRDEDEDCLLAVADLDL